MKSEIDTISGNYNSKVTSFPLNSNGNRLTDNYTND